MLRLSTECKKNSYKACWYRSHFQNYIRRGRSSGNEGALREQWYSCNWSSWSTSRTIGCDSPSSRAISREFLYGSLSTVAVMASSLASVRTVRGQTAFTCAARVTLPVSQGDPIVEPHLRVDDVHQDGVALVPAQQFQLDYYTYRGLRARRSIRCVCIPWSFDRSWPLLCTAGPEYT
jgi:hypothetical protein